jgi:hypothetical protein
VVDSFGRDRAGSGPEGSEEVLADALRGLDRGAAVLRAAREREIRVRGDGLEEALLAVGRAGRALLVAEHDDVALAHARRERLARGLARRLVVGGDEADRVASRKVRVEHHHGHVRVGRLLHRADEALVAQGRKDDPADALRDEGLHHVDLVLEIVLAQRSLPHDLDAQLARRLHRAGVNALPELVGRALGHHGDAERTRRACPRVALAGAHEGGKGEGGARSRERRHAMSFR